LILLSFSFFGSHADRSHIDDSHTDGSLNRLISQG
jgi:hypothetical protein